MFASYFVRILEIKNQRAPCKFYIGWDKTYLEIIYQGSWSSIHARFIVGWGQAQPYLPEGGLYYV